MTRETTLLEFLDHNGITMHMKPNSFIFTREDKKGYDRTYTVTGPHTRDEVLAKLRVWVHTTDEDD